MTIIDKIWRLLHTPEGAQRFCKLVYGETIQSGYNSTAYARDKERAKAAGVGIFTYRNGRKAK